MMRRACVLVVLLGMMGVVRGEPYADKKGASEVGRVEAMWRDGKRQREVPVLICYPKDVVGEAALPVIVFSHGLGGSRTTYQEYGTHWASHGYVVIFPQHHGSDTESLGKGAMTPKDEMKNFTDRVEDVHFVLDQLEVLNAGKMEGKQYEVLKGKLDGKKIGIAGHSFGAITTTAIAGQKYDGRPLLGKEMSFADERVTAGMAMSPYPPTRPGADYDAAYGSIKIPVLYLTGSADNFAAKAEDRRIPFDHSKPVGTALLTLTGADHLTFAPFAGLRAKPEKAEFQKLIREASTAYWDATLKGDGKAKEWLTKELGKELGVRGRFEERK